MFCIYLPMAMPTSLEGPKGKKFKYKQLQEVLLANASRSMEEQKTILEDIWMSGKENWSR